MNTPKTSCENMYASPSAETQELRVLMQMMRPGEAAEWQKWEEDDLLFGATISTLCDVRRHVETIFGEKSFSDFRILEAIRDARGRVTNRLETETPDLCLVNLDKVVDILRSESKN